MLSSRDHQGEATRHETEIVMVTRELP
jgi:hypothetical protein